MVFRTFRVWLAQVLLGKMSYAQNIECYGPVRVDEKYAVLVDVKIHSTRDERGRYKRQRSPSSQQNLFDFKADNEDVLDEP